MLQTLVVSISLVFALFFFLAPIGQVYSKANKRSSVTKKTKKKRKVKKKRKLSKKELRKRRYKEAKKAWMAEWKKEQEKTYPKKGRSKSFLYRKKISKPVLGMTWGITFDRYHDREYTKGILKHMQIQGDGDTPID